MDLHILTWYSNVDHFLGFAYINWNNIFPKWMWMLLQIIIDVVRYNLRKAVTYKCSLWIIKLPNRE